MDTLMGWVHAVDRVLWWISYNLAFTCSGAAGNGAQPPIDIARAASFTEAARWWTHAILEGLTHPHYAWGWWMGIAPPHIAALEAGRDAHTDPAIGALALTIVWVVRAASVVGAVLVSYLALLLVTGARKDVRLLTPQQKASGKAYYHGGPVVWLIKLVFLPLRVWLEWRRLRPVVVVTQEIDADASARWASDDELALYRVDEGVPIVLGHRCDPQGAVAKGAALLRMCWSQATQNMLIIAPPGGGKSVAIITSLLRQMVVTFKTASLFVWDVSGELEAKSGDHLRDMGYEVIVLHPYNRKQRINPLEWCTDLSWITVLVRALIEATESGVGSSAEKFYEGYVRQILTAGIMAIKARCMKDEGREATLVDLYDTMSPQPTDADEDAYFQRVYNFLLEADDRGVGSGGWKRLKANPGTWSNGKQSLLGRLEVFVHPDVRWFVEGNDVDLDQLLTRKGKPLAVFFQIPTGRQEAVAPLTAATLALWFALIGHYSEGKQLDRGLVCLLDETGSGSKIYGLESALDTLRKAGVAIVCVVQLLAQLKDKYGPEGAARIKNACGTWIGMRGMDVADAKELAERMGQIEVKITTVTTTPHKDQERDPRVDRHTERVKRPLFTDHKIRWMPKWVYVVSPRDMPPFLVYNRPYFLIEDLKARAGRLSQVTATRTTRARTSLARHIAAFLAAQAAKDLEKKRAKRAAKRAPTIATTTPATTAGTTRLRQRATLTMTRPEPVAPASPEVASAEAGPDAASVRAIDLDAVRARSAHEEEDVAGATTSADGKGGGPAATTTSDDRPRVPIQFW